MELGFRDIARNLNLSVGTVHNHFKRFRETGNVSALPVLSGTRALDERQELVLIGLLLDNPALYLSEVCQNIVQITSIIVSPPTVCRIIHRHGMTHKKIRQVALQRSLDLRGQFMSEAMFLDVNQLVWVDEMGSDNRDHIRKFGYSLRGETPVSHRILSRWKRISAIGAMCTDVN